MMRRDLDQIINKSKKTNVSCTQAIRIIHRWLDVVSGEELLIPWKVNLTTSVWSGVIHVKQSSVFFIKLNPRLFNGLWRQIVMLENVLLEKSKREISKRRWALKRQSDWVSGLWCWKLHFVRTWLQLASINVLAYGLLNLFEPMVPNVLAASN